MKIIVTPRTFGQTDPGVFDLLKQYGLEADVNDTGAAWPLEVFQQKARDCDGIIFGVEPITAQLLDENPRIRAVAKYGVGIDNVDVPACQARGVKISRAVGANAMAVGEFAFGMALDLVRRITRYNTTVRQGKWAIETTPDMGTRTMGILGLGAIGKVVAARAQGFEMKVLAYDPIWDADYAMAHGIEFAEPECIYQEADFISVHMPLTPQTRDFIGAREIAMMKPTAVLVNCARGGIVNEDALYDALKAHRLYGAGLDVFVTEPHVQKRWFELDNVLLSPHAAGQSFLATERMGRMAVENIARDLGVI